MRSRILTLKPYDTVDITPYRIPFRVDEKKLEYEMNRLRNPYISWKEGKDAGKGDTAVCRMESGLPRFNKENITVAVGSGMLPKELETVLDGMTVGESKAVVLGEDRVDVTLLSVKNKVVPELSDEMVRRLGLEGIETLNDYREYLIRKQKTESAEQEGYEANQFVLNTVLDDSEFVLHKSDWDRAVELKVNRLRVLCKQDGLVFEEMTEAEFAAGRVPGVKCHEGVVALEREYTWPLLQKHLAGRYYAEQDGIRFDEDNYEQYIQEYVKAWHVTEEDARESNTYEFFLMVEYANYFGQKVWNYVTDNILMEG